MMYMTVLHGPYIPTGGYVAEHHRRGQKGSDMDRRRHLANFLDDNVLRFFAATVAVGMGVEVELLSCHVATHCE